MLKQDKKIDTLEIQLRDLLEQCRQEFSHLPAERFRRRPQANRWNAEECFAHLNASLEEYFPKIEKAIHKAKARQWMPSEALKTTWWGQRNIRKVSPELPIQPRKCNKKFNFLGRTGRRDEYKSFLINLEILLRLLRQARDIDISRTKVKAGIWWFAKACLHEIFQYLIDHARRHMHQIRAAIND